MWVKLRPQRFEPAASEQRLELGVLLAQPRFAQGALLIVMAKGEGMRRCDDDPVDEKGVMKPTENVAHVSVAELRRGRSPGVVVEPMIEGRENREFSEHHDDTGAEMHQERSRPGPALEAKPETKPEDERRQASPEVPIG